MAPGTYFAVRLYASVPSQLDPLPLLQRFCLTCTPLKETHHIFALPTGGFHIKLVQDDEASRLLLLQPLTGRHSERLSLLQTTPLPIKSSKPIALLEHLGLERIREIERQGFTFLFETHQGVEITLKLFQVILANQSVAKKWLCEAEGSCPAIEEIPELQTAMERALQWFSPSLKFTTLVFQ